MKNDMSFNAADNFTLDLDMSISYVNVPNPTNSNAVDSNTVPVLIVTTAPKHDKIGVDSTMKTTQVCVNLKACDLADDDSQRAPVDIIVALDVSGSMSGSKLDLCRRTLLLLLRVLFSKDRFGLIICYAENSVIEVPVQKVSKANKKSCMEKIQGLRTRGCTNLSSAVGLAFQEMTQIEAQMPCNPCSFLQMDMLTPVSKTEESP